jgi:DNA ligase-1
MFKAMLAGKLDAPFVVARGRFPVLASPKLDGIRATIQGGVVMSRSLKPIANLHVQALLSRPELEGLDGELIVGDPTAADCFRVSSSAVMSVDGKPNFAFHVFDKFMSGPFAIRLAEATKVVETVSLPYVQMVPHNLVEDQDTLIKLETLAVDLGYEGLMIRSPKGPYKQGRSTSNEGFLMKMKRFVDGEGEVLDLIEQEANNNVAFTDELGHTKRSSHAAGKALKGTLGAYLVKNLETGIVHKVSPTGTLAERQAIWNDGGNYIGKIVKFKFFASGGKDKPRFPQFVGFRDAADMDAKVVV